MFQNINQLRLTDILTKACSFAFKAWPFSFKFMIVLALLLTFSMPSNSVPPSVNVIFAFFFLLGSYFKEEPPATLFFFAFLLK